MGESEPLHWLRAEHLLPPLARLMRPAADTVTTWVAQPVTGGQGLSLGVWRLTGTATSGGSERPWALILKGWAADGGTQSPSAYQWPLREARAYGSDVLSTLPGGVQAPRGLGRIQRDDGSTWLWLEPVDSSARDPWDMSAYARAAWHLGRFNGAWLSGARPLPDAAWLSRQWTRQKTEAARPALEMLATAADYPIVGRAFPPDVAAGVERIWRCRAPILTTLDHLPQTFAHLDAFPRNAFLRTTAGGDSVLTLIDWAFAGLAAVGEDATPLVVASVFFGETPAARLDELSAVVFDAYVDGLRDAGWGGSREVARRGYVASLAARWGAGSIAGLLPFLLNTAAYDAIEADFGQPMTAIADNLAEALRWVIHTVDTEAPHLLDGPRHG